MSKNYNIDNWNTNFNRIAFAIQNATATEEQKATATEKLATLVDSLCYYEEQKGYISEQLEGWRGSFSYEDEFAKRLRECLTKSFPSEETGREGLYDYEPDTEIIKEYCELFTDLTEIGLFCNGEGNQDVLCLYYEFECEFGFLLKFDFNLQQTIKNNLLKRKYLQGKTNLLGNCDCYSDRHYLCKKHVLNGQYKHYMMNSSKYLLEFEEEYRPLEVLKWYEKKITREIKRKERREKLHK